MEVVYAKALSVPDKGEAFFTEGREYIAHVVDAKGFYAFADDGAPFYQKWGPSCESSIIWQRLEYPYRDPEAVEALIAAAEDWRGHDEIEEYVMGIDAALARLSPDDGEVKA
jgi:hypothetical protein